MLQLWTKLLRCETFSLVRKRSLYYETTLIGQQEFRSPLDIKAIIVARTESCEVVDEFRVVVEQVVDGDLHRANLVAGRDDAAIWTGAIETLIRKVGLLRKEEAFFLPTQQPRDQIPAQSRFFSLYSLVCVQCWDQTHGVLSNGFQKCSDGQN